MDRNGQEDNDNWRGIVACELSSKRRVTVVKLPGRDTTVVNIREYYTQNGRERPKNTGICLTVGQWKILKDNADAVDEAIDRIDDGI